MVAGGAIAAASDYSSSVSLRTMQAMSTVTSVRGDQVSFMVMDDLKDQSGQIVLERGEIVMATVAHARGGQPAKRGLLFIDIPARTKNGVTIIFRGHLKDNGDLKLPGKGNLEFHRDLVNEFSADHKEETFQQTFDRLVPKELRDAIMQGEDEQTIDTIVTRLRGLMNDPVNYMHLETLANAFKIQGGRMTREDVDEQLLLLMTILNQPLLTNGEQKRLAEFTQRLGKLRLTNFRDPELGGLATSLGFRRIGRYISSGELKSAIALCQQMIRAYNQNGSIDAGNSILFIVTVIPMIFDVFSDIVQKVKGENTYVPAGFDFRMQVVIRS